MLLRSRQCLAPGSRSSGLLFGDFMPERVRSPPRSTRAHWRSCSLAFLRAWRCASRCSRSDKWRQAAWMSRAEAANCSSSPASRLSSCRSWAFPEMTQRGVLKSSWTPSPVSLTHEGEGRAGAVIGGNGGREEKTRSGGTERQGYKSSSDRPRTISMPRSVRSGSPTATFGSCSKNNFHSAFAARSRNVAFSSIVCNGRTS